MRPRLRVLASRAVSVLLVLSACGTPPPVSCPTSGSCPGSDVCVDGECVAAREDGGTTSGDQDAGPGSHHDGGTHVDAGSDQDGGTSTNDDGGTSTNNDGGTSTNNDGGQMMTGQPITCSAAATYKRNGGSCGSERWSVKTGTDHDVLSVDRVPQVTTIGQLRSLPVPANQSATCNRNAPGESQVWELQNVTLHFHSLESDSDYHIVATDAAGHTMIVEVPYPGCVGHDSCSSNSPFMCEITHARAAADAFQTAGHDSVGTVIGIGFFDFKHGQVGVAPNAIELHPVLALCFGENCNPLRGY